MGLGKLLAEQGSIESAQYRFDRIENLLIPNIQRLIAGFRDAGAHIIWITYGANAADASDAPATSLRSSRQQITSQADRARYRRRAKTGHR